MFLQGLVTVITLTILGVAIIGYHPLPTGLENPIKVQVAMGILKLLRAVRTVQEYLGYGSPYQNVKLHFLTPKTDDPPKSAAIGDLKVTRDTIAGVPVIVYQPKDNSGLYPAIVYFHGGGWVTCSADMYDTLMHEYAVKTGTVIINVDYRLAPEHPFPTPVQDCIDVTRFILQHGAKYNIDVTKVGVAGDSAGGNLAASVALKLTREPDLPRLLFQIIHYPAMQAFDLHLPSYIDLNQSVPILTQDQMAAFYAYYMGVNRENIDHFTTVISENRHIPADVRKSKLASFVDVKLLPPQYQTPKNPRPTIHSDYDAQVYAQIKDIVADPLFSPLMAPDLTGLPPAFVQVCEFDVLRDDGFLYARRLQDAGVQVKLHFGKGGFHGDIIIYIFVQLNSAESCLSEVYSFVKDRLGK
ncbi:unnamed protein product [Candidula unifasciata]|uniref:Alpha/beta hydrolase fold-3 domain-containing protein n=1 Tax=Candidula unifasciata TaxID=100452 RepID=A0A8S3YMU9_9EUPU|nr:unnamed protein product [Candidula unifasciata]